MAIAAFLRRHPWLRWAVACVALLLFTMSMASCSLPVRVQNTPERPVPVAPMGVMEQEGAPPVVMNPVLGDVDPNVYHDEPWADGLWDLVLKAGAGDWLGAGAGLAGVLAGALGLRERNRREKENEYHKRQRRVLAELDPENARRVLEAEEPPHGK